MCTSILQEAAAGIEEDTSVESKLIDAENRLLAMEEEQLEIPEIRLGQLRIRELFAYVYSRS